MQERGIEEIVTLAKSYSARKIPWYHHFLTLECTFNKTGQFQIILENEEAGDSFIVMFDYKPMKELELLENIFFSR